jgi:hypothetical protein
MRGLLGLNSRSTSLVISPTIRAALGTAVKRNMSAAAFFASSTITCFRSHNGVVLPGRIGSKKAVGVIPSAR